MHWVLSSHLWILYHHILPLQCYFQKFAGVTMKCTLNCHSILTTPLPLLSGISVHLHICDTPRHSQITLQCHFGVHIPLPPHDYHSNANPTLHSIATLECLWSVNLHICDALLQLVGVTLYCTPRSMEILRSIDTPRTLYCHSVEVR